MRDRFLLRLAILTLGCAAVFLATYAAIIDRWPIFGFSVALMNACMVRLWVGPKRKPVARPSNVRPTSRPPVERQTVASLHRLSERKAQKEMR